jgi:DNA-binding response OmpR family regulator
MSHEEKNPRLVVAHGDPAYAALVCHMFRQLGWDAYRADSGPAVRKLAREVQAQFVVLDALLPNESGWLTCDKLRLELPEARSIIVAVAPRFHEANFAVFVGAAALVAQGEGVQALLDEIGAVATA